MCHDCIGVPTRYLVDPTCLSNTRKKYIKYIPRNSSGIDGNTKGAVTSRHNSNLCTIFCHEQLPWAPYPHLHETIPFRVILLIACVICMYALRIYLRGLKCTAYRNYNNTMQMLWQIALLIKMMRLTWLYLKGKAVNPSASLDAYYGGHKPTCAH